jgi:hypothetical protein
MQTNLALLPDDQREAIELDKQRWFEANKITASKRPEKIREWLNQQENAEYREDMRRRLNVIRNNALNAKP